MDTKIIKNNTNGYGYKYASLSDIAKQNVEIPLMKIETCEMNGKDYIYYFDEKKNEWFKGAQIVVTTNKGMNEAQNYASGVTYARRVTTQLAKCLACADDEVVENTNADGTTKESEQKQELATQKQIEIIIENQSLLIEEFKALNVSKPSEVKTLTKEQASALVKKVLEKKKAND